MKPELRSQQKKRPWLALLAVVCQQASGSCRLKKQIYGRVQHRATGELQRGVYELAQIVLGYSRGSLGQDKPHVTQMRTVFVAEFTIRYEVGKASCLL